MNLDFSKTPPGTRVIAGSVHSILKGFIMFSLLKILNWSFIISLKQKEETWDV